MTRVEARNILARFDKKQIDFVGNAREEALSSYSRITDIDDESQWGKAANDYNECKRDFAIEAYEDDLLTPEQFDEIFDAIDRLDDRADAVA